MRDYLSTILPRIQQYSKQLNDEANFVEIPWAFLDEAGVKVTYIFRRNNELLVSRHGDVATGRWEYLPVVQSLLIEYQGSKRLYNQGFLDKAVMVLRKDGTEELFALGNSQIVADLNISRYLESKVAGDHSEFPQKRRYHYIGELAGSRKKVVFWSEEGRTTVDFSTGTQVTMIDKSTPLPDGEYKLNDGGLMKVKDGRIQSYKSNAWLVFLIWLIAAIIFCTLIPLLLFNLG